MEKRNGEEERSKTGVDTGISYHQNVNQDKTLLCPSNVILIKRKKNHDLQKENQRKKQRKENENIPHHT